jgi:hypothetical protein
MLGKVFTMGKSVEDLLEWIDPPQRYASRIKDSGTRKMFLEMYEKLNEINGKDGCDES